MLVKLSFLELQLMMNSGRIVYDWYDKLTFSGRILNFKSNNPISEKSETVYSMVAKVIVFSDPMFHKKNIVFISSIPYNNTNSEEFVY